MGLMGYNKLSLAGTVNAPGSTHNAHLLRHTGDTFGYCRGQCISKVFLSDEKF